ncbi:MAG: alanine racemase [Actinomycetaceae bacterium]|nr:alanine racemase [Actinomycetaceae bacterium]
MTLSSDHTPASACPAAPTHPGVVTVDLDAIAHNFRTLAKLAPTCQHMAVVKANAYGHGLIPVARAALAAGAHWLGVAQLSEALELRAGLDQVGIARDTAPILTWISGPDTDWTCALEADLDLSVGTTTTLAEITAAARDSGKVARLHLKVDTGMSRAGATLADLPALVSALRMSIESGLVDLVGVWSHISRGDDPSEAGLASTQDHCAAFEQALRICDEGGVHPQIRHLGATSAILFHPEAHYDMVRAGIGLYGLEPDATYPSEAPLRPALRVEAPLTSVKVIEQDTPVSYGGTWRSPSRRWVGLVPVGYADGIDRSASNGGPALVYTDDGPRPTRIIGRVCMDQIMIDLGEAAGETDLPSARTPHPPARVGDRVVLIGDPARGEPSADDWARACSTINYEIVTRLGPRLTRTYSPALDEDHLC